VFGGIHLAGANTQKTALVLTTGDLKLQSLNIYKVYEKIGSLGSLFSDDRLLDILRHVSHLKELFVDCPLSVPPCVACQRPRCPGVVHCEDTTVAYMLKLSGERRNRRGKRGRPINPQCQRMMDLMPQKPLEDSPKLEPSFSGSSAPLVVRALTLQKRLNSMAKPITMRETVVANALVMLAHPLGLTRERVFKYKKFELGKLVREETLRALVDNGWLSLDQEATSQFRDSIPLFQGLITSLMAAFFHQGFTIGPPKDFHDGAEGHGWVYLPEVSCGFYPRGNGPPAISE
jgi:hypothetical protein